MSNTAIRQRDMRYILEKEDEKGRRIPFDAIAFTKEGKKMVMKGCTCSSSYHTGTYNIVWPESNEVRKLYGILFTEINGKEIFV